MLDMNKYGKLVFETVEEVLKNANEDILSSILYELAYLNQYDIEKSFSLFFSIVEKASDELFIYSFNPVQYFVHHDFSRLDTYFIRAKKITDETFRKNVSAMLYFAWLRNYPNAEFLLFDYIDNDTKCISEVISRAITNFYFEEDMQGKKAKFILNKYISYDDEHISHQYDCCFLHCDEANVKFEDLYLFIRRYIASNSFNSNKYYVLDYLLDNSAKYPDECFLIFKNMKFDKLRKEPETEYSPHVREKQMQLLMGFYTIYNQKNNKYNSKNLKYINGIFDKLFENIHYKSNIDKALDLIAM
jgi:hypothetical protein